MSVKVTKRDLTYFLKRYPVTKLFANPSVNVPTLLHLYLLQVEQLQVLKGIRDLLKGNGVDEKNEEAKRSHPVKKHCGATRKARLN